jgi:hypothetical protein
MALAMPLWLGATEIGAELKRLPRDEKAGDVYAFLDDGAAAR